MWRPRKGSCATGFFTFERPCHACCGRQIITDPCPSCSGAGHIQQQRTLSVSVPAGVEDGTRIRLSGEGDAGERGAGAGDLYVFVDIKPHSYLQRDGADLFCAMPVPFGLALKGGALDVPLLSGKRVKLTVPAGAQTGQQFRLRGKGMPILRARNYGDLYIQIDVEMPGLSREQQKLLDAFEASLKDANYPGVAEFKARSKKLIVCPITPCYRRNHENLDKRLRGPHGSNACSSDRRRSGA